MTTATVPSAAELLACVDAGDLRALFVEHLGWSNPDQPPLTVTARGADYTLTQVAGYKGLRVWHCPALPDRPTQRAIDAQVDLHSYERLVIFTSPTRQEWRWPRRAQTGGVNAKLLVHAHDVGQPNPDLAERLAAIAIDVDEQPTLVELLGRMRAVFDRESEAASVRAANLMKALYDELEASEVDADTATLLLARLLFLLFADDSDMWVNAPDLFQKWLTTHTTPATLHTDLAALFKVLDTDEKDRKDLPAGDPLRVFRYVNGGLFDERIALPRLRAGFRDALVEACAFDWSVISPAVFGSMFQVVKDKAARRPGGEHYTTEANILKTIGPLFLDELHERLEAAWDDKGRLTRLHNDLGRLRVLDPACGCGNFLIVAYRELRALELEILKRRADLDQLTGIHTGGVNRSQGTLDVTDMLKVRLDHFAGIEIDEWPARIAAVAMLLVDHLANQKVAEEFGVAPDRLPIKIAPAIHRKNALRLDWASIFPASDDVVVVGNPPFTGRKYRSKAQVADMRDVWGAAYDVNLDYVTCWYKRAVEYFGDHRGRFAFVSTNSVCQGEPVPTLWRPILSAGWRARFAHRSFRWQTEAPQGAAVHVSILGFDRASTPAPVLYTYPEGPAGPAMPVKVSDRINPYLIDGPDVLVDKRTKPLNPQMPKVALGSMPNDGGHLLVEPDAVDDVRADPVACKYLRPFVGADELLKGKDRWCLWLVDMDPADVGRSPLLAARLAACRQAREDSRNPDTVAMATHPHLFWHIAQPSGPYLCIPSTVSETRRFFTPAYFSPDVIAANSTYIAEDPDAFLLGVLSSTMFITWMRTIGGRLKSDLRFSRTFSYDTFPIPRFDGAQRAAIAAAGKRIVTARAAHPGTTLVDLYRPGAEPADLLAAHADADAAVDAVFGLAPGADEHARQLTLLASYADLVG